MDTASEDATKQRVQFDFTPEALKSMDEIKNRTGATTRAEVVRSAIKLYDWFTDEVKEDYVVEVQDRQGNVVFKIPAKLLL